jgi:hypothetical protein
MNRRIRFRGVEYLLVGDITDGSITTPDDYGTGCLAYAHLFPDGLIRRFGEEIGSVTEIEVLGEVEDVFLYVSQHIASFWSQG